MTSVSAAAPESFVEPKKVSKQRTLWRDAARRFSHNRLAMFGLVLVVFFVILAVFADFLAPHPYDKVYLDRVLLFPFEHPAHPLGTDEVGRDYLSRLIYGARTSIFVGVSVMFFAVLIGLPIGGIAGYVGGATDWAVSRLIEIMTAFPGILFAILVISVWGGGVSKVILALSITAWIEIARLTRAQMLSLREKEFVESARAIGVRQRGIIARHLIPNALSPILVAISFGIPAAMFAEAGLSFLGIGINDPFASWGKMVGVSNSYVRVYLAFGALPDDCHRAGDAGLYLRRRRPA